MTRARRLLARLRRLLRLTPLVFAAGCMAPVDPPHAPPAAVARAASESRFVDAPIDPRAVVVIVSGFQRTCLGVAVSPVHVYTAAHCIRTGLSYVRADRWVERGGVASPSATVPLVVRSSDAGLDRALLEHADERDEILPAWLDIAPATRDAWVWAVVYRAEPARLERLLDTSGEPGYFASARIEHGDSGGPVIAENGLLVGIVTHCRNNVDQTDACNGGGLWRPFGVEYPETR